MLLTGYSARLDRRTLKRAIGKLKLKLTLTLTLTLAKADRRLGCRPLDERVSLTWADGSLPQVA